jgi:hypothetical protein
VFGDPFAAGDGFILLYVDQRDHFFRAPAGHLGVGREAVAEAFGESGGEFFGDGCAELGFRPHQTADGDQQEGVIAGRGAAETGFHFGAVREASEVIDGGSGFQAIDALVEHADFDLELGDGDLMLSAHLLHAVFDGGSGAAEHAGEGAALRGIGDFA